MAGFPSLLSYRRILHYHQIIIQRRFHYNSIVIKDDDLTHSIKIFHPDHISLVGTQLKKLLDRNFNPGYEIKNILVGGGFTDDTIIKEALEKNLRISKVYGSTETAAFVAAAGPEEINKVSFNRR
jgi:acyl-CoA synthetase (AMP-forming)/AMP-acid ligase II